MPGKFTVRRIVAVKRIPFEIVWQWLYITPRQAQDSRAHHKLNLGF